MAVVQQWLLHIVLSYCAKKGLSWLESFELSHEAEVHSYVEKLVPVHYLDELAWAAVKAVLKEVVSVAKELVHQNPAPSEPDLISAALDLAKKVWP